MIADLHLFDRLRTEATYSEKLQTILINDVE